MPSTWPSAAHGADMRICHIACACFLSAVIRYLHCFSSSSIAASNTSSETQGPLKMETCQMCPNTAVKYNALLQTACLVERLPTTCDGVLRSEAVCGLPWWEAAFVGMPDMPLTAAAPSLLPFATLFEPCLLFWAALICSARVSIRCSRCQTCTRCVQTVVIIVRQRVSVYCSSQLCAHSPVLALYSPQAFVSM